MYRRTLRGVGWGWCNIYRFHLPYQPFIYVTNIFPMQNNNNNNIIIICYRLTNLPFLVVNWRRCHQIGQYSFLFFDYMLVSANLYVYALRLQLYFFNFVSYPLPVSVHNDIMYVIFLSPSLSNGIVNLFTIIPLTSLVF